MTKNLELHHRTTKYSLMRTFMAIVRTVITFVALDLALMKFYKSKYRNPLIFLVWSITIIVLVWGIIFYYREKKILEDLQESS